MADSMMDLKGKPSSPSRVTLERGPVSNFATAVTDDNAIYHDASVAREHGFDHIPVPPTYPFAWGHFGEFVDQQPEGATGESAITQAIGTMRGKGGLILHGEQEFVFHRTPVVGETLTSKGEIKDVYTKEGGSTMTFVVMETTWSDEDDQPVVTSVMTLLHKA